jgi:hypothetical protein
MDRLRATMQRIVKSIQDNPAARTDRTRLDDMTAIRNHQRPNEEIVTCAVQTVHRILDAETRDRVALELGFIFQNYGQIRTFPDEYNSWEGIGSLATTVENLNRRITMFNV